MRFTTASINGVFQFSPGNATRANFPNRCTMATCAVSTAKKRAERHAQTDNYDQHAEKPKYRFHFSPSLFVAEAVCGCFSTLSRIRICSKIPKLPKVYLKSNRPSRRAARPFLEHIGEINEAPRKRSAGFSRRKTSRKNVTQRWHARPRRRYTRESTFFLTWRPPRIRDRCKNPAPPPRLLFIGRVLRRARSTSFRRKTHEAAAALRS